MNHADDSGSEGFRGLGTVDEPIDAGNRDGARSGYRVFAASDGFELAIAEHVIERALRWGRASGPNEWYGLIVGRIGMDDRGRHVVVLGFVPDHEARATPGFVETSHASEFATRALCRRLYPDGVIVGWVHGHHRCGARYSDTDRRNQATWTQPHSIGIVVDPWDPAELAVYRGPSSELLSLVPVQATRRLGSFPEDVGFRAVASGVTDLVRSTRASEPRSPRPASGVRSTLVLAALMVAFGVFSTWHGRRDQRSLDELARRVQALEARPLAVRCSGHTPTPDRTPAARPFPLGVLRSGPSTSVGATLRSRPRRPVPRSPGSH